MSEKLKDLREMSLNELIDRYDKLAKSTVVGTNHYLNEIICRDQEKSTKAMLILYGLLF